MPKITSITLTPDDLLEEYRDASYDRPSAYYALCFHAGIEGDIPELSMHAAEPEDPDGWEGDSAKALAHIEEHFGIANVPVLFTQEWDT